MLTQKIQELNELRLQAAKLATSIEQERIAELSALPGKYGYSSVEEFIKALKQAAGVRGKRKGKTVAASAKPGKRSRAKITPELKEQVKAAVLAGKTGAQIAAELGISLPSIQNIKKEFGLVSARKESVSTPAAS